MSTRQLLGVIFCLVGLCSSGLRSARAQEPSAFRIVVHESNSVQSLDRDVVSKIFLRKVSRWPDGHSIVPVDLEPNSRARLQFSRTIHRKSVAAILSFWQRMLFSGRGEPPMQLGSDVAVLDFIRSERGAIGYVASTTTLVPGVRALELIGPEEDGFRSIPGTNAVPVPGARASELIGPDREASRSMTEKNPAPRIRQPLLQLAGPGRFSHLWAGPVEGRLFTSLDAGGSWVTTAEDLGDLRIRDIVALPSPLVWVAVSAREIFRSLDAGVTWESVQLLDTDILSLARDTWDPRQVFLATTEGLWRSEDRGESFQPLAPEGVPIFTRLWGFPEGGLLASSGSDLWQGSEQGERWIPISRFPNDTQIYDLTLIQGSSQRALAATSSGIWISWSSDSEILWRPFGLVGSFHAVVTTPSAWIVADADGLFASSDSGGTWNRVARVPNAALAVVTASGNRVMALGSDGSLLSSSDGGLTWRRDFRFFLSPDIPLEVLSVEAEHKERPEIPEHSVELRLACRADREHVAAIVVDPFESSRVYAAGQAGVFRSLDFGATWQDASTGLEIRDVHALAIDPKDSMTLYAGTHGAGVFKSTDGAASWWPARRGLMDPVVHALRVDPALPSTLQAATASGLYGSTDAGASWRLLTPLSSDPAAFPCLTSDSGDSNRWLAGSGAGELWLGDSASLSGRFLPGDVLLPEPALARQTELCNGKEIQNTIRVLREEFGIELDELRVRACAFDRRSIDGSQAEGLLAGTGLGVFRSEDHGHTWSRLPLEANLAALVSLQTSSEDPETTLLAGTADGLWRGVSGDEIWRRLPFDRPVLSIAADPTLPSTLYAGSTTNRIGLSQDGGDSWREVALALPIPIAARDATSSGPQARRARAPGEVTATAERLWRALWRIPPREPRRRALVATELLARAPARLRGEVRGALEQFLSEIRGHGRGIEPNEALRLGFSPGERWLQARFGAASCVDCTPELRLFDLDRARFSTAGTPLRPDGWMVAHDLSLEPPHLVPRWILGAPGEILAWSSGDHYLATRGEAGVEVWDLGRRSGSREEWEGSPPAEPPREPWRLEIPASLCPGPAAEGTEEAGESVCEVALSSDGRRLAFVVEAAEGPSVLLAHRQRDRVTLEKVWTLSQSEKEPTGWSFLRFAPDATRLFGFASDGSLWMAPVDVAPKAQQPVFVREPLASGQEAWREVAFDARGRWLAAIRGDDVELWPVGGRAWPDEPQLLPVAGRVAGLTFSPDGRWLAVGVSGGGTTLFDLEGRADRELEEPEAQVWIRNHERWPGVFSRDSRRWTSYGSFAQVLDLETGASKIVGWGSRRHSPRDGLERWRNRSSLTWEQTRAYTRSVPFLSHDHRWLATYRRHDFRLWDLSDSPTRFLHGQIERPWPPTTSDGASRGLGGSIPWPDGPLANLETEALRDLACAVVGRNLTSGEWRLWVGVEPWQPTCHWPERRSSPSED